MWVEDDLMDTNFTAQNWIIKLFDTFPVVIPISYGNSLLLKKNQRKTEIVAFISSLCPYTTVVKVSSLYCDLVTNRDRLMPPLSRV